MTETIRFEWDPAKAERNRRDHGISFETATLVFADPFVILAQDRIEDGELRWQTLGSAGGYTVLLVAHVFRDEADIEVIRIISARRAQPHEKRRYEAEARPI